MDVATAHTHTSDWDGAAIAASRYRTPLSAAAESSFAGSMCPRRRPVRQKVRK